MLGSTIYSFAAFLVALGLLITIHEFGHYWVARRCGVKVLRFSIGFGKPLWKRVAGEDRTEYVLAAIPLGGYVKMLDEREGEVAEEELDRAFNRKGLKQRSAIVVAGPMFNFILAVVLFWLMYSLGVPGDRPLISEVLPDTPASRAGIMAGDEITAINGQDTPTWTAVQRIILTEIFDNRPMAVQVRRADRSTRELSMRLGEGFASRMEEGKILSQIGYQPLRLKVPPVVGEVDKGSAAERGGLRTGDKIVSADGEDISDWGDMVTFTRARPGRLVRLRVERGGSIVDLEVVPDTIKDGEQEIGRLGMKNAPPPKIPEEMRGVLRYGPVDAVIVALEQTWEMSVLTLRMLGKMIIGEVSFRNLSGPVTIADYAGKTASHSLVSFLNFLAVVSVSLGVLNLLPIPILDGGHLLLYGIEGVRGRAVSEKSQMRMQQVGLALLLLLMSVALYNDFARLTG